MTYSSNTNSLLRARSTAPFITSFLILILSAYAAAQTATYHLHKEASSTSGLFQLKTAGPDGTAATASSVNLKSLAVGEYIVKAFDTQSGVPNASGSIPSGAAVTFTLWMKKSANGGAMFPRARLRLNNSAGTLMCEATGSTALTTTLTKYTLTATTASSISMSAADRLYLWVGVNLTATSSSNVQASLNIEGALNGNYDSLIIVPSPSNPPAITGISPVSGPAGTPVTISGSNFGSTQGASTVKFNGVAAAPTSWSATSIVAPVPAGATTGPVVVTVGGAASNGVTFTVGPRIDSLSPTSGVPGTSVTISGAGFGATQGTSTVTFNGKPAATTSWSSTAITATAPQGFLSGPVVVTVGGVASNGVNFANTNLPPAVNMTGPPNLSSYTVPVNVTLTATATDFDGTVSKVEFFKGATKLGESAAAPYSYAWNNVPAGNYSLTAKATDNHGATSTSSPIDIVVNPITVPVEGRPCPDSPSSTSFDKEFSAVGDSTTISLNLAPCETVAVTESHDMGGDGNRGTNLRFTYYNNEGRPLFGQTFWGFFTGANRFPDWTPEPYPWRGVRGAEALPAYLIIESVDVNGWGAIHQPPKYSFSVSRRPRRGYNTGGTSFSGARTVDAFPTTFNGSLREEEIGGQFFKFTLASGQTVRVTGFAEGSTQYGAIFRIDLYDAAQQPLFFNGWVNIAAYGLNYYASNFFTNTNATPVDYYIRVRSTLWPVYDFELNIESDKCPLFTEGDSPAPDATGTGPNAVTSAEYRFAPAIDTDILAPNYPGEKVSPDGYTTTGREVEMWARLYRPANISGGPYPLIVFLHGNHGTCGVSGTNPRIDNRALYTTTGVCPAGYEVVPNHAGYDYLAQRLASWGYLVLSINANRGITAAPEDPSTLAPTGDPSYIMTRGRLVLKHLQLLSQWNQNGGTPSSLGVELQGKIDFNNVGLMGHSRGGEGVRAAYTLYKDAASPWPARILSPLDIKAIFEIAPTDSTRDRDPFQGINPVGTRWNVLLPMCDGDVSNLAGVRPFDRMIINHDSMSFGETPTQKSSYTVWGANHNYFNTQWQGNESFYGCAGRGNIPLFSLSETANGSTQQQQVGLAAVLAFFRANVGPSADSTLNQNFNTLFGLPPVVFSVTRADRGFTPSPNSSVTKVFEDFKDAINYCPDANHCAANVSAVKTAVPNHDADLSAALIAWTAFGPTTFFKASWRGGGSSVNAAGFQNLDFRISRQNNSLNPAGRTNFSIRLVMENGTESAPVMLCKYADVRGPVGRFSLVPNPSGGSMVIEDLHPILQTVRIPLTDFAGADLTKVSAVKFVFDNTPTGSVFLTNIRFAPNQ